MVTSLMVLEVWLIALGADMTAAGSEGRLAPAATLQKGESVNRDKIGTRGGAVLAPVSQVKAKEPVTAGTSLGAERAGFEPAVRI